MAKTTLTIEFKGLCAFVADRKDTGSASRIHVVMMDTDTAETGVELCPHDPIVVYRLKQDFLDAGEETRHHSFSSVDDQDLGFWMVKGKSLTLAGIDPRDEESLIIDKTSYQGLLSLDRLNAQKGTVARDAVTRLGHPGVGALLTIEHGCVSAERTSGRWGLAPRNSNQKPQEFFTFQQVVCWSLESRKSPAVQGLRLTAGGEEWIEFRDEARVVICNLCPLTVGGPMVAEDVLAYYALCEHPLPERERHVLHPEQVRIGVPGAADIRRPGVDACPPLTGYLS